MSAWVDCETLLVYVASQKPSTATFWRRTCGGRVGVAHGDEAEAGQAVGAPGVVGAQRPSVIPGRALPSHEPAQVWTPPRRQSQGSKDSSRPFYSKIPKIPKASSLRPSPQLRRDARSGCGRRRRLGHTLCLICSGTWTSSRLTCGAWCEKRWVCRFNAMDNEA